MTMLISDLPMDLLSEIVCRVPLKSIKKVRLTCKTWDTLSKSEMFRKMHMSNEAAREQGETRMVTLIDYKLHYISVFVKDVNHPHIDSKGCLNLDDLDEQEQVKILEVFHCEGLLLCVLEDTYRLVVWNPYLCQVMWVEPPSYYNYWPYHKWKWDTCKYALGYNHNKKSHKILRFKPRDHYLQYEIYDFDSTTWRHLDVRDPHWCMMQCQLGVPLRGNSYWLHLNDDHDHDQSLVCFDFTTERLGPLLPLPLPDEEERQEYVELSCLKEEKLMVSLQFQQPLGFEIWFTATIDPNNVSWSKFLKVDRGPAMVDRPFNILYISAGLFMDKENKVFMGFAKGSDETRYSLYIIGDGGFLRQVDIPYIERARHTFDYTRMCSCYVPSSVQIKKPPLSDLEIHPCEPSKSRLEEKGSAKGTRRT